MKIFNPIYLFALMAALISLGAHAQDNNGDPDEDTIVVLEEDALPDRVFVELRLPDTASDVARERAAQGLDTANQARELGREFGQQRAEQARAGELTASEIREQVRERIDLQQRPAGPPDGLDIPRGAGNRPQ